jgi:hypothetical protein
MRLRIAARRRVRATTMMNTAAPITPTRSDHMLQVLGG